MAGISHERSIWWFNWMLLRSTLHSLVCSLLLLIADDRLKQSRRFSPPGENSCVNIYRIDSTFASSLVPFSPIVCGTQLASSEQPMTLSTPSENKATHHISTLSIPYAHSLWIQMIYLPEHCLNFLAKAFHSNIPLHSLVLLLSLARALLFRSWQLFPLSSAISRCRVGRVNYENVSFSFFAAADDTETKMFPFFRFHWKCLRRAAAKGQKREEFVSGTQRRSFWLAPIVRRARKDISVSFVENNNPLCIELGSLLATHDDAYDEFVPYVCSNWLELEAIVPFSSFFSIFLLQLRRLLFPHVRLLFAYLNLNALRYARMRARVDAFNRSLVQTAHTHTQSSGRKAFSFHATRIGLNGRLFSLRISGGTCSVASRKCCQKRAKIAAKYANTKLAVLSDWPLLLRSLDE